MEEDVELKVFQLLELVMSFIARFLKTHTDALLPLLTDILMDRKQGLYANATSHCPNDDVQDADDMSEDAYELETLCPSAVFAENNQVNHAWNRLRRKL
jgi:hypothetical protein